MNRISGTSRPLVVIGDPIAHSLSPGMYNAAITALGIDAVYVAVHTDSSALPHFIRGLEAVGIAGNVTIPHKMAMARLLIRLTPVAKELEAVNTFWPDGGRLVGDNTDVQGVVDALHPLRPEGPWLLRGTGGGARAVAAAARELGAQLLVQSGKRDRAVSFVAWARDLGVECQVDKGEPAGTAINATPLGLRPSDPHPFPSERLQGCRVALDLVYAPGQTGWIRECRRNGMKATDGRTMLVAQGARSFERFFPGTVAPREIMQAAVDRVLER